MAPLQYIPFFRAIKLKLKGKLDLVRHPQLTWFEMSVEHLVRNQNIPSLHLVRMLMLPREGFQLKHQKEILPNQRQFM